MLMIATIQSAQGVTNLLRAIFSESVFCPTSWPKWGKAHMETMEQTGCGLIFFVAKTPKTVRVKMSVDC